MAFLDRLWKAISEVEFGDAPGPVADPEEVRKRAQAIAPVVWLLGKTGAGKTAIVAALTGDPRAEVGEGFEPCTRTAAFYDVPPEVPLLRFLDTRGLGEADYDPANDIAWCEGQSHLLLIVMQVADPAQHALLGVLRQARRRHPDWPVIVAQTGLHRLYPAGIGHPKQYPYRGGSEDETQAAVPHALRQALAHQRRLFEGLPGRPSRFVAIDFTVPEDGVPPYDFGLCPRHHAARACGPLRCCLDSCHARPVQRSHRRRRTRVVDAAIWLQGGPEAHPDGWLSGGWSAQCGGSFRGDRGYGRGRLRLAGLPATRPDGSQ